MLIMVVMTESAHRRTQRVRRKVLAGLKFAQENGITVKPSTWMTYDSACALGTLFHKEQLSVPSVDGREDEVAAKLLGISLREVDAFIGGFDNPKSPASESEQENFVVKTKTGQAFYRLGQRLNREYVNG